MWSVPRRRRLCSHSVMIHRRELPCALGSLPMTPCTLVASTIDSRSRLERAWPTMTSASTARWMIRTESSWSVLPQAPNIIAPRQSGLTCTPVRPSVRWSMTGAYRSTGRGPPGAPSDPGPLPLTGHRVLVPGGRAQGPGPAPGRGVGSARRRVPTRRRPAPGGPPVGGHLVGQQGHGRLHPGAEAPGFLPLTGQQGWPEDHRHLGPPQAAPPRGLGARSPGRAVPGGGRLAGDVAGAVEVDRDDRAPGAPGQVGGSAPEGLGPTVGGAAALGEDD